MRYNNILFKDDYIDLKNYHNGAKIPTTKDSDNLSFGMWYYEHGTKGALPYLGQQIDHVVYKDNKKTKKYLKIIPFNGIIKMEDEC